MSLRIEYDERAISQAAALSRGPGAPLLLHVGPYVLAGEQLIDVEMDSA